MKTRRIPDGWRLPIVLLVVCLGLAAVVGRELMREPDPVDVGETAPPVAESALDAGDVVYEPKPIEAFDEIVERPLFQASRRPAPPQPGAGGTAEIRGNGQFVVAGIIVGERRRLALVIPEGEEKPVRLEVGQSVSGWTIDEIQPTRVVFRNGQTLSEVSLVDRRTGPVEEKPSRPGARPAKLPTKDQKPRAKP